MADVVRKIKKSIAVGSIISSGLMFSAAAISAPSLSVGVASALPGQTINIPFLFENDAGIASLQFDIQYDSGQLSFGAPIAGSTTVHGQSVSSSDPSVGIRRIVITPTSDNKTVAPGTLIEIPVTVDSGATTGGKTITLTNVSMANGEAWPKTAHKIFGGVIANDVTQTDTDNDGMSDSWEFANGFDATNANDSYIDTDGDGLINSEEYLADSDPSMRDTDGDGFLDGQDLFPLVYNNTPESSNYADVTDVDVPVSGTLPGTDSDGDALTFTLVDGAALGTVQITDPATGAFTYTPNDGMLGTDTFTFQVTDGPATSTISTVTIDIVIPANIEYLGSVFEYGFTETIDGAGREMISGSAIDSQGNVYVTGDFYYESDFDFTEGVDLHTPVGVQDVFVTKINADGSYGWTKTFGGTSTDKPYGIAIDALDNIFVAGEFRYTVDFDPGAGVDEKTAQSYRSDAFVTKLNSDGSYAWTNTISGYYDDNAYGVAVDSQNAVYITGRFNGWAVDFDNSAGSDVRASNGADIFVTKFHSDGSYGWAHTPSSSAYNYSYDLAIDNNDNVFVTGSFGGTVDFAPGAAVDNHSSTGSSDVFVMRMTAGGSYVWTETFGGSSTDNGRAISVGESGDLIVTGDFWGTVDFDPSAAVSQSTAVGGYDVYLVKLNTDGTYQWHHSFGSSSSDEVYDVEVGLLGDVFVTGGYWSTVDFAPGAEVDQRTSLGLKDLYLTKYNKDGDYGWVKSVGDYKDDLGRSINIDGDGNLYLAGYFNAHGGTRSTDFNPDEGEDFHTANASVDGYITKWLFYPDTDGDTYGDHVDAFINDPLEWLDTDNDSIGNNADSDDDGDLMPDTYEVAMGFDPLDASDGASDYDGDGLSNGEEYLASTDPMLIDSDADGMIDSYEVAYGLDPLNGTDGTADTDADGYTNLQEFVNGTNPTVMDSLVAISNFGYGGTETTLGTGKEEVTSIATDAQGNTFIAGYFWNTYNFDVTFGTDEHYSNGANDVFITKINADGSYGWSRTFGGTSADEVYDIAVDSSGAVYLTGKFYGSSVDFDPTGGVDLHSAFNYNDIYVMKLNANGSYGWAHTFGGSYYDQGNSIVVDGSGTVWVTGNFMYVVDFDPTSGVDEHTSVSYSYDVFVTRLGIDGTYIGTDTFGNSGTDMGNRITVDDANNIYLTGSFSGSVDLDPGFGIDTHASNGSEDVFVLQLRPNGDYGWARSFGGSSADKGRSLAVGFSGDLYVVGDYAGKVDFDHTAGVDESTSQGGNDVFLVKLGTDGSYSWHRSIGGSSADEVYDVAVGKFGDVFVGGAFQSTVDFDPTESTDQYASAGYLDAFLTKYNSQGEYGWTKVLGTFKYDYLKALDIDLNGSVCIGGFYNGNSTSTITVDFGTSEFEDLHTTNASTDGYFTKWLFSENF